MRTTVVRAMRKFLRSWDSCLEFFGGCDRRKFFDAYWFHKIRFMFHWNSNVKNRSSCLAVENIGDNDHHQGAILGEVAK